MGPRLGSHFCVRSPSALRSPGCTPGATTKTDIRVLQNVADGGDATYGAGKGHDLARPRSDLKDYAVVAQQAEDRARAGRSLV